MHMRGRVRDTCPKNMIAKHARGSMIVNMNDNAGKLNEMRYLSSIAVGSTGFAVPSGNLIVHFIVNALAKIMIACYNHIVK